jgi:hypothetical protein
VFAGALYINGGWPALPDFDANAIKQFLADEQPSLVFFWLAIGYFCLALGYFHHGYLIRRNSALLQKAVDNAAAALQMTETETHRQRHYHLARIRAAQPRWEVNGCIAHKGQYEIHVRNLGAAASKLSVWKKDLPIVVMLSNTAFVDRGQEVIVKVMFKEQALDEFNLTLEYCDAASEPRTAEINASAAGATIQQEVF